MGDAPRYSLLDVDLVSFTAQEAWDCIVASRHDKAGGFCVHLCNAWTFVLAASDESYRTTLLEGDLRLPDGRPVAAVGGPDPETRRRLCRGPDLMRTGLEQLDAGGGLRQIVVGGHPESLELLHSKFSEFDDWLQPIELPFVKTVDQLDVDDIVRQLKEREADVVWLAIGTPKQDLLARTLAKAADVAVVCVGAAADMISGKRRECPRWMRGSGLEWLYRLWQDPRRLWRRYLIGNARFIVLAAREKLRARPAGA